MQHAGQRNISLSRGTLFAVGELALATVIFLLVNIFHVIPVSETPWILLLGWISLRLRGQGWKSLGLIKPESWGLAVGVAAAAAVALQLLSTFVTEPLVTRMTGQPQDLSKFAPIVGNLKLMLAGLAVIWTLAAFGEELVYRGYVLNRAADVGSGTTTAWTVSLVAVSVVFGLGHLYQGATGVVAAPS